MRTISKSLVIAAVLSAGLWAGAVQAALIGQWTFNEGAGTTAQDSTANNNDGTLLNGAGYVASADPPGGFAASFDGANDEVSMGAPATFDLTSFVSLEVWVNPTSNAGSSGEKMLLGKQFGNYAMTLYHNGNAYFYWDGGGNNVSAPVGVGVLTHLVGTYDGSALRLYTNGVLASSLAYVDTTGVSGDPLRVGGGGGFGANYHGLVEQAAIYDQALSASEVLANFNAGPIPEPSVAVLALLGLTSLWRRARG